MAIWQFEIALLPAATDMLVWTNRGFDLTPLPLKAISSIRPVLGAALGTPCLDDGGTAIYGKPDGNRVHLIPSGAEGCEMWVGIDARSDADHFCKLIVTIAQYLDCELFSPEIEQRLPPDPRALGSALMNSRAWIYALDPSQYKQTAHGWMHI